MTPHVSERAEAMIDSPIRKFAPYIAKAEREGVRMFKMDTGDPDRAAPGVFFSALRKYPSRNVRYAPSSGSPEHVAAWVKYYRDLGVSLEPADIIPTVGCAEAISFALQAIADPGDEIIVFEPLFVGYRSFATMAGAKLVPVSLELERDYALPSVDHIARKITRRTRGIIVVNPDNPTGKLWQPRELSMVVSLARKHGLFVIADETYREIRFTGRPYTMLSRKEQNIIVVDSVSKRFSLPGARLGCIVSRNKAVMRTALRFAQSRLSAGTLEQFALQPVLRDAKRLTAPLRREYEKRRDIVYAALRRMPGVVCNKPEGAFYITARLPVDSAEAFVMFMITKFRKNGESAVVAPMRDFYVSRNRGEKEIRIAYVLDIRSLKCAMELIGLGLNAYRKLKKVVD